MSVLRVLLVDDEALSRLRLRSLLADCVDPACVVVGEAVTAPAALHWLTLHQADVVLLDIHMPGMDGLQLAERLRGLPWAPGVIFVTAHAEHALAAFEADPQTKVVAMMGEIGGTDEQEAAEFVRTKMTKPVIGFIAGQTAPPGRRMGHAGAIISGSAGTAAEKLEAFAKAGMGIAKRPMDFVELVKARL